MDSLVSAARAADRAVPTKRGRERPRTEQSTVHCPLSTVYNFRNIYYEKSDLASCFGGVDEWRYYVRVGL